MGCIQMIDSIPNIYVLTALCCYLGWSKYQTQFAIKKYITISLSLALIALSFTFPITCGTPCDWPCNTRTALMIITVAILVLALALKAVKFIKNRFSGTDTE